MSNRSKSIVDQVEAIILGKSRIRSRDVAADLSAELELTKEEVQKALKILQEGKRIFVRRKGGRIVSVRHCQSAADRNDRTPQDKKERMFAKDIPSTTSGGDVEVRYLDPDAHVEEKVRILNECIAALKKEMNPETRAVKRPVTLLVRAMSEYEFDNDEAQKVLRALHQLGVIWKTGTGHFTNTCFTEWDGDVTVTMYKAWQEREVWGRDKRSRRKSPAKPTEGNSAEEESEEKSALIELPANIHAAPSVDEMTSYLKSLIDSYGDLRKQLSEEQDKNARLSEELVTAQNEVVRLADALAHMGGECDDFKRLLADQEAENSRLAEELAELKRKYATAKENLAAAAGLLGDLQLD